MQSAPFDIWHVAIPASNLEDSLKFYLSLGFVLLGTDEYPSKKQAFVATKPGGFSIELFQDKKTAVEVKRPDHLAFECICLSQFRESLVEKGISALPPIDEYDNGVKFLSLKDPDGVAIEFFEGRKIYEASIAQY